VTLQVLLGKIKLFFVVSLKDNDQARNRASDPQNCKNIFWPSFSVQQKIAIILSPREWYNSKLKLFFPKNISWLQPWTWQCFFHYWPWQCLFRYIKCWQFASLKRSSLKNYAYCANQCANHSISKVLWVDRMTLAPSASVDAYVRVKSGDDKKCRLHSELCCAIWVHVGICKFHQLTL